MVIWGGLKTVFRLFNVPVPVPELLYIFFIRLLSIYLSIYFKFFALCSSIHCRLLDFELNFSFAGGIVHRARVTTDVKLSKHLTRCNKQRTLMLIPYTKHSNFVSNADLPLRVVQFSFLRFRNFIWSRPQAWHGTKSYLCFIHFTIRIKRVFTWNWLPFCTKVILFLVAFVFTLFCLIFLHSISMKIIDERACIFVGTIHKSNIAA